MPRFNIGTPVNIFIPVAGETVVVPGIVAGHEYTVERPNRNTGRNVPVQMVETVTFHNVPADRSRTGEANTYYKLQPQSVQFMERRLESCAELDELTNEELVQKLRESRAKLQSRANQPTNGGTPVTTKLTGPISLDEPLTAN